METQTSLHLTIPLALKAQNAGLFVSRGGAMHPTRVIASHELIFIKQGELVMWEDDLVFCLAAGDILHLWPGRRHGSTQAMPLGLKFYWIHFEIEDNVLASHAGDSQAFSSILSMPQTNRTVRPEKLEQLFLIFLEDQVAGNLQPCAANLLLTLMLVESSHPAENSSVELDTVRTVATWAHTYIKLNYDSPITAGKVANAIGYNADYVERTYHQVYKCTLTDAIHQRRIHVACQYLLDTQNTVEQIAFKCGFSDPDYFRRIFRRYIQMSPRMYRKEYARIHVNTH